MNLFVQFPRSEVDLQKSHGHSTALLPDSPPSSTSNNSKGNHRKSKRNYQNPIEAVMEAKDAAMSAGAPALDGHQIQRQSLTLHLDQDASMVAAVDSNITLQNTPRLTSPSSISPLPSLLGNQPHHSTAASSNIALPHTIRRLTSFNSFSPLSSLLLGNQPHSVAFETQSLFWSPQS